MTEPISTTDLRALLRQAIEHELTEFHVALPGKIEKYDPDTNLAAVKPTVSRRFVGASGPTEYPVIPRVPVLQIETAAARISFPIKAGDVCLLLFTDRSLENWIDSNGQAVREVDDLRAHHLSDAIAIPGGLPSRAARAPEFSGALNVELRNGTKIAITNGKVELLDMLDQLFQQLDTLVTNISLITVDTTSSNVSQPINPVPDFTVVQTAIANIKTLLGQLKA